MGQQEQPAQKWETIYQAVRAAYDIRVANLQAQQQRIANVLFANGLIFGFLGASAGVFFDPHLPKWPSTVLYVASMSFLAFGLVAAVVALWPSIDPLSNVRPKAQEKRDPIKPEARFFLEPASILEAGRVGSQEALLEKLSSSVVGNAAHSQHVATFSFRRRLIRVQLLLIVSGVVLLFCALICRHLVP